MKKLGEKMCILAHIYDFLNGGCFASHHQLRYYDEEIYGLYLKNDRDELNNLYDKLKKEIPTSIVESVEKSAGIRYFLCDGCHDAKITEIKYVEKDNTSDYLIISLDTSGMLGCLDLNGNSCKIIIETIKKEKNELVIDDFNNHQRLFWISNDVVFDDNEIYFELELDALNCEEYERLNCKFKISNILIEE